MTPNQRVLLAKWFAFLAVLAVLLFAAASRETPTAAKIRTLQTVLPSQLVPVGGVVRREPSGWAMHDPGHAHNGTSDLTCDARGVLHIDLDPDGVVVGYGSVTPDEQMASRGITVGVSAGRDELRLYFYQHGSRLSCRASVFKTPWMNAWMIWWQVTTVLP